MKIIGFGYDHVITRGGLCRYWWEVFGSWREFREARDGY